MIIRPYSPEDETAVIQLWHDCNLVVPQNDPKRDIELKLQFQPELFLVGELEGKVIGSVMGGYDGHRGWIYYLAVAPTFQRRGFGRLLVEAVCARLRDMGCPKVNLMVRESNLAVIAFYEGLGFEDGAVRTLGLRF